MPFSNLNRSFAGQVAGALDDEGVLVLRPPDGRILRTVHRDDGRHRLVGVAPPGSAAAGRRRRSRWGRGGVLSASGPGVEPPSVVVDCPPGPTAAARARRCSRPPRPSRRCRRCPAAPPDPLLPPVPAGCRRYRRPPGAAARARGAPAAATGDRRPSRAAAPARGAARGSARPGCPPVPAGGLGPGDSADAQPMRRPNAAIPRTVPERPSAAMRHLAAGWSRGSPTLQVS